MTPITTKSESQGTPRRRGATVAALDRRGGAWRLVIDRRARGGGFETATLADGDLAGLGERLAKAGVTRLVRVVPACATIAKIEAAPEARGEELAGALGLFAEAALPEDAGLHRRGAGLVGEPTRALAAAWIGRETGAAFEPVELGGVDEVWTTEPAAVLSLSRGEGFALLSWDRENGSVFALRTAGERPVSRCVKLDGRDESAWRRGLAAAAASVGIETPVEIARGLASDTARFGSAGVAESVAAGEFGVAIGAVLVETGDFGPSLAGMRRSSEDRREGTLARGARWISVPGRAAAVIAAGLAVCMLAPMGFAWARMKVVESKLEAIGPARDEREALRREAALYRQMEQSRWPMTKLLADVSNATPVGVVVESLTIEKDGSSGVMMKGRADNAEQVTALQKNLGESGVLGGVQMTSVEADGSGVSFSLSAKVVSARSASKVKDDFAKRTLQDRIYDVSGAILAGAVPTEAPAVVSEDEEDGNSVAASGNGGGGSGGGGNGGTVTPRPRSGEGTRSGESATSGETNKASKPLEVPPPLTDEQINAMDKSTATKEWALRRAAAQRKETSTDDRARLEAEVKKLEPKWKGGGS